MQNKQNATRWIVVAAIVYPTILTLAYFRWLDDAGPLLQRGVFQGGKLLQFLLPAVWVWWVLKQKPGWSRPNRRGLLENLVFGGTVTGLKKPSRGALSYMAVPTPHSIPAGSA